MPNQAEKWCTIPDSTFAVSNLGNYTNIERWHHNDGMEIEYTYHKTTIMPSGKHYAQIRIGDEPTNKCLATLICEAFNGQKPNKKSRVVFIDGDLNNCRADNLKWGTLQEFKNSRKF